LTNMCNTHTTCPWEAIFGGESLNNVGAVEVYFVCDATEMTCM